MATAPQKDWMDDLDFGYHGRGFEGFLNELEEEWELEEPEQEQERERRACERKMPELERETPNWEPDLTGEPFAGIGAPARSAPVKAERAPEQNVLWELLSFFVAEFFFWPFTVVFSGCFFVNLLVGSRQGCVADALVVVGFVLVRVIRGV